MTDRLKGVVVTFEGDIREDDAAHILGAIRMIKGVTAVDPIPIGNIGDYLTRTDERRKLHAKIDSVFRAAEVWTEGP